MNILNFDFKKTEKTHKRLDRTWSRVLFYYKSSSFQHEVKVCTINSKEQKKNNKGDNQENFINNAKCQWDFCHTYLI